MTTTDTVTFPLDLSIVIPNWNKRELLRQCLSSIHEFGHAVDFEVIVVDNNSSDGSVEMTRELFPATRVIRNRFNHGYATATNQGILTCRGRYVLLLNNDVILMENTLHAIVEYMDRCPHIGALGCQLLNPDGGIQPSCRSFPTLATAIFDYLYLDRIFKHSPFFARYEMSYWGHDDIREVDQPSGTALTVRREVIDQVGLLDEQFFLFFNDVDYCYRIKRAGWPIVYFPGAQMIHLYGQSSPMGGTRFLAEGYKNMFAFYNKYYGERTALALKALMIPGLLLRVLFSSLLLPLAMLNVLPGVRSRFHHAVDSLRCVLDQNCDCAQPEPVAMSRLLMEAEVPKRPPATVPQVSIVIVNWNGLRFLPQCLESVFRQSYESFEVILVDNASRDGSGDFVREQYPQVRLIENTENTGFCRANNQAIRLSRGQYVFLLNPDIVLTDDCLEKLVRAVEIHPRFGLVGPKLLKLTADGFTDIIDSTGIVFNKYKRVPFDRGEGIVDQGQWERFDHVLGVSGAAAFYRREMLDDVAEGMEFFDENFFTYYEDVDLAWRAQSRGWHAIYCPWATAFHARGGRSPDLSRAVQIRAFKNRYLLLLKNDSLRRALPYLPIVMLYEGGRLLRFLFTNPFLFRGFAALGATAADAWRRRREIRRRRTTRVLFRGRHSALWENFPGAGSSEPATRGGR